MTARLPRGARVGPGRADLSGLDRLWLYDEQLAAPWQFRYPRGRSCWLAGSSFCHHPSLWKQLSFSDVGVAKDARLVRMATMARVLPLGRDAFYAARVHDDNTSRKQTGAPSWFTVSREKGRIRR
jgi:hypothetical protein